MRFVLRCEEAAPRLPCRDSCFFSAEVPGHDLELCVLLNEEFLARLPRSGLDRHVLFSMVQLLGGNIVDTLARPLSCQVHCRK